MSVFNSISAVVLIILLVAGLMMGLSAAGIDLLNPNTSVAKANQIAEQTQHQQVIDQQAERLTEVQTDAQIQSIQREQQLLDAQNVYKTQILNQDLTHRDIAFRTWMAVLIFIGIAVSIGIIIATSLWIGSKALAHLRTNKATAETNQNFIPPVEETILPLPKKESNNSWSSPTYRKQRVKAARQEERKQRKSEIVARMNAFRDPARMSKEEYDKSPLAGD